MWFNWISDTGWEVNARGLRLASTATIGGEKRHDLLSGLPNLCDYTRMTVHRAVTQ